ncbi:MAG: YjbF family lipoprotein [Rhodobacterales bacterium]
MKTYSEIRLAAVAGVALSLSGCGNDQDRIDFAELSKSIVSQVGGADNAQGQQAIAAPADVLAQISGPVIIGAARGGTEIFYLIGVRDNGPYRTYATGTRQTMTFRQGVVTATRGAGNDLMSSDIDQTLALLRSGQDGQARRVMQYLDAEDITSDLVLDCTITTGLSAPGAGAIAEMPGRKMTEDCTSGPISFSNSYSLDGTGRVTASVQWLSTDTGPVVFKELRP